MAERKRSLFLLTASLKLTEVQRPRRRCSSSIFKRNRNRNPGLRLCHQITAFRRLHHHLLLRVLKLDIILRQRQRMDGTVFRLQHIHNFHKPEGRIHSNRDHRVCKAGCSVAHHSNQHHNRSTSQHQRDSRHSLQTLDRIHSNRDHRVWGPGRSITYHSSQHHSQHHSQHSIHHSIHHHNSQLQLQTPMQEFQPGQEILSTQSLN